jgi:hypothetical protein
MASRTPASNKPGTERYRDERRKDPNPKMQGDQWHELEGRDLDSESMAGAGAITGEPIEGSPDGGVASMSRTRNAKRKRMTPVSKQHKATKPKQGARTGMKGRNRSGNPG